MTRRPPLVRLIAAVLPISFVLACAEPPDKEINQAQGAIDAARAAGAERYAPTELAAALDALARAEQAVRERDFRLALAQAIDSRTRAQDAAKAAGDAQSKARGDAERALAELATLVALARSRLEDPAVERFRAALREETETVARAEASLQEARAAVETRDYARAAARVEGLAARVQAALTAIDERAGAPATRRRR